VGEGEVTWLATDRLLPKPFRVRIGRVNIDPNKTAPAAVHYRNRVVIENGEKRAGSFSLDHSFLDRDRQTVMYSFRRMK
jgi:hypothetical protein